MASLTRSFTQAETYVGMGLDPATLKSVTVSVCMPGAAVPHDLRVMEAKDLRSRTCH